MKKNLLIVLVVVFALSLMLTACGESVSRDPGAIFGEWKSGEMSFTFVEDGSMTGANAGQTFPGAYDYDGTNLKIQLEGADVQAYTVEITGDSMTMTDPSGTQTFTKVK